MLGIVLQVLLLSGQGPLDHFPIAALGNVEFALWGNVVDRFAGGSDAKPIAVVPQGIEEANQPTTVVDMLLGVRPGAKLLAIVSKDDHGAGRLLGDAAEVVDRLVWLAERNGVA